VFSLEAAFGHRQIAETRRATQCGFASAPWSTVTALRHLAQIAVAPEAERCCAPREWPSLLSERDAQTVGIRRLGVIDLIDFGGRRLAGEIEENGYAHFPTIRPAGFTQVERACCRCPCTS